MQDTDFEYAREREVETKLVETLLHHADEAFGEAAVDDAWDLFNDGQTEDEYDDEDPLNEIFLPWFVFNWTVDDEDDSPSPGAPIGMTVAESYLERHGESLSDEQRAILTACNRMSYSFYEVADVEPGAMLTLKDLLRERTVELVEREASKTLKRGDIVLASTPRTDTGRQLLVGLSPFALPEARKAEVAGLKAEMLKQGGGEQLDDAALRDNEADVIGIYLDLLDEMLDEEEAEGVIAEETTADEGDA